MRKIIFLVLSFLISSVNQVEAKKLYVEMEFHNNCIKLDDGTNKKSQTLKDNNGEELRFTTLISALNYMSLLGWELMDMKTIIKGSGVYGTSSTNTKVYYIFYRDVSEEELKETVEKSYKK